MELCPVSGTEGRRHKLKCRNIKTHCFTVRVIEPWHRLPWLCLESPSLEIFKSHLGTVLGSVLKVSL